MVFPPSPRIHRRPAAIWPQEDSLQRPLLDQGAHRCPCFRLRHPPPIVLTAMALRGALLRGS